MSRCVRWTIAGIYLFSLPFMRRAWELAGAKSPFLARAIPLASGVALLLALLWRLVLIKREARIFVWLSLAAVCVVYALMFHALPQQIERVHLSQYALLSVLVFWAMGDGYEGYVLSIWAAIVTVELGLADECLQGLLPSRIYDLNDVVLNAKAALMGQAVVAFVLRPWERGGRNLKPVDARPAWPGALWLWCAGACVILLAAFNIHALELGTPTITQDVHRGDGAFAHRDGFLYFGMRAILLNATVLAVALLVIVWTRRRPGERARSLRTAVTCGLLSPLVLLAGRLMGLHFR